MTVRDFVPTDVPQIHRIYNESKLDELKYEDIQFTLLPLKEDAQRSHALWESDIYVYERETVVGYGALFKNEVRALFVDRDSRDLGFGKRLLEHMLSRVVGSSVLYVAASNSPAIRLYEHYGFRITDTFQTEYNGTPVSAHRMENTSRVE